MLLSGCATWSPFPPVRLLARGDALVDRGRYPEAVAAYDEVVRRYPDSDSATSAGARRGVVASLVTAREQLAALRQQLAERQTDLDRLGRDVERLSRDVAVRDAEIGRLRHEQASRQSDVARLTVEMDQLRADLERLKRIEMRLERRRP